MAPWPVAGTLIKSIHQKHFWVCEETSALTGTLHRSCAAARPSIPDAMQAMEDQPTSKLERQHWRPHKSDL